MVTRKFLHAEAGGQLSKKSKKGGAEGCVSHDSPQRKSILRENGKLGSNHTGCVA